MMFLLRAGLIRNLGGIGKNELYSQSNVGTKAMIESYVQEIVHQINRVSWSEDDEITPLMKENYFSDVLQSFGRTALIFHGGGASFGLCHLGVAKALHDANRLPKVICGSYVGALIAGLVCATDEGLHDVLAGNIKLQSFENSGSWQRKIVRFLKHGKLFDIRKVEQCAKDNIGNITFKEAFAKTGRILNITVHAKRRHEVPVLLNYLTAPDVVIWSAASASCAIPGMYDSVTLMAKGPRGEIVPWNPSAVRLSSAKVGDDIPASRLTELFNVNNFIVSHVPSYFSWRIRGRHYEGSGDGVTFVQSGLLSTIDLWFSRLWNWWCQELHHRLHQLKLIGLAPTSLRRLEDLFSDPEVGDVHISPVIWTSDIVQVLANPTPDFLAYCIRKGEQATWRRMSQIDIRCAVEFELEAMKNRLRRRRKGAPGA